MADGETTVLNHPVCHHCGPVVVAGERWDIFVIDYWFEGKYWPVHVYARSWAEAEARAKALQYAKVEGGPVTFIPVTERTAPLLKPFVSLWCWLHNWLSSSDSRPS